MYRRELKKLHDTKSSQAAGTANESKWKYFTSMSFVNAVMIPRPTLSKVPAASSVSGSARNLGDGNAKHTIRSMIMAMMGSVKGFRWTADRGTKRKIKLQEETLHLEIRTMKLMEERKDW